MRNKKRAVVAEKKSTQGGPPAITRLKRDAVEGRFALHYLLSGPRMVFEEAGAVMSADK